MAYIMSIKVSTLGCGCSSVVGCQPGSHDAPGSPTPWTGTMKEGNESVHTLMRLGACTYAHTYERINSQDNEFNFCALRTSFLSYLRSVSCLLYPHTGMRMWGKQTSGVHLFSCSPFLPTLDTISPLHFGHCSGVQWCHAQASFPPSNR